MRAPGFWAIRKPTALARLLQPVGALYGAATARRMAEAGEHAGAPAICVGNFVAGGAGKTPAAIALAQMLIADRKRVAFLSRGYGGAKRVEPVEVDPNVHDAAAVGDEPLLLARVAPCWVGPDRVQSARRAVEAGAEALILDDGLQNPALAKDLAFAVIDGETGFGNGLCVPAGPLRAPLAAQAPHVRALIVIGGDEAAIADIAPLGPPQADPSRHARAGRARRRAPHRPRGRRLRRHRAAGEVLRDAAARRGADRRHPKLSGPPSVQAARDRGAGRRGRGARRAAGDDREGPRAPSDERRPGRGDAAGDAAVRRAAGREGHAAAGVQLISLLLPGNREKGKTGGSGVPRIRVNRLNFNGLSENGPD